MRYRAEIDGLRAIAVGAVLLYHAKLGLPGGFVGVDVFFVISGYLITSLILRDLQNEGGFSLVDFWKRRIRRIFPALLLVLISTFVLGWFFLLPSHFKNLGESLMFQGAFLGNLYFWGSVGYFGDSTYTIPLLHTWSLAVEEQFYILFPLIALVLYRKSKSILLATLAILTVGSLVLSQYQLQAGHADAAFYLLPSRAWELLAGCLLAFIPERETAPSILRKIGAWLGVLILLGSFLFFNESMPFPGLTGLGPVAGTVFVIWGTGGANKESLLVRLLSLRPIVFVGLISYSLYLWHWPILIFATYWEENHIVGWPYRVGLLGLSVLLATLSWKFVEQPVRHLKYFKKGRNCFFLFLALPITSLVLGGAAYFSNGVSGRFPERVVEIDFYLSNGLDQTDSWFSARCDLDSAQRGEFPTIGPKDSPIQCLVWGDSHAMAVMPALEQLSDIHGKRTSMAAYTATPPVRGFQSFLKESMGKQSDEWADAVLDYVKSNKIPNVLMVANWLWYYNNLQDGLELDESREKFEEDLSETIKKLNDLGAKVWILERVPLHTPDYHIMLAKQALRGDSLAGGMDYQAAVKDSNEHKQMINKPTDFNVSIIEPLPKFYPDGGACLLVDGQGYLLYIDNNHLSSKGAIFLQDLFKPIFE